MKLTRVVIYFQDRSSAIEHMHDLADKPPAGASRWRVLAPRYFGTDMSRRAKWFLVSVFLFAVAALITGFLWR